MPIGKPGTGYWSNSGWVEGGSSKNDPSYSALTNSGQTYGVGSNNGNNPPSRNDTNYGSVLGASTGTIRPRNPGETKAEYAAFIAGSPFLIPDDSSGSGFRSPTQTDYNNYSRTYVPTDKDILASLIAGTQATTALNTPQSTYNPESNIAGVSGLMGSTEATLAEDEKMTEEERRLRAIREQGLVQKAQKEKGIFDLISKQPTQETLSESAGQAIGLQSRMAEERAAFSALESVNKEYSGLVAARDEQIAKTQDRLGSMNVLNNMVNTINQRFKPQLDRLSTDINTQAAVLAYRQSKVSEAQKFIDKAVEYAVAAKKDLYDQLAYVRTENDDVFKYVDSEIKNAYDQRMELAANDLEMARHKEKLRIEDEVKGNTGSTIGSAETGYTNVVRDSKGNIVKTEPITGATVTSAPIKLTSSQANSAASLLGMSPDEYKQLDPNVQNFFVNTGGKTFMKAIDDLRNEESSREDIVASINESLQPQEVKDYMLSLVDKVSPAPTEEEGPGFWKKLGNWVSGIFK